MAYDPKYDKGFVPLVEETEFGAFNTSKDGESKNKIMRIAKGMASKAWSIAFGLANVPVVGSIPAAVSGVKTLSHINQLKKICDNDVAYPCKCENEMCKEIIGYIIHQKDKKAVKKAMAPIPFAGMATAVVSKARFVEKKAKKTQGRDRLDAAAILWNRGRMGCTKAKMTIYELFGGQPEGDKILGDPTGYEKLANKLKSS